MLRAIRMIQEKTSAPVGDDVTDKQRIKEVADAATGMQRTLQYFLKSMVDHAHNSAAIHEDLANLYPAHQALSNGVATLNKESGIFASGACVGGCAVRGRPPARCTLTTSPPPFPQHPPSLCACGRSWTSRS